MKTNKGFSLVELIVVIAIMAIIAAVAIPVYSVYLDKANKAADEQLVADIKDVLTYALTADTTGTYTVSNGSKMVGAIKLSQNGIQVYDLKSGSITAVTDGTIYNALKDAFGENLDTELTLKFDEWDASAANSATAAYISNSNFFSGDSTAKVGDLLGKVQTLTDAFGNVVAGITDSSQIPDDGFKNFIDSNSIPTGNYGNAATFFVANQITESVTEDAFVDAWKKYYFDTNNVSFNTLITDGTNMITPMAAQYAAAYALVQYLGDANVSAAFSDATDGFNSVSNVSAAEDQIKAVINATSTAINNNPSNTTTTAKFEEYHNVLKYNAGVVSTKPANYDAINALIEADARGFYATLDIAKDATNDFAENFAQEDMYTGSDMVNYITSQVSSMNGLKDLGLSGDLTGSYVITVINDSNGKISFVSYC